MSLFKRSFDVIFILFALLIGIPYALLGSLPQGLGISRPSAESSYFLWQLVYPYLEAYEPLQLHPTLTLDFRHLLDGVVGAPLLVVIVYGMLRRRQWVRFPAIVYAVFEMTSMAYHVVEMLYGAYPVPDVTRFLLSNSPWLVLPPLLLWRFRML